MNPIQSSEYIRIVHEAMVGEEHGRGRLSSGTRTSLREVVGTFLIDLGTRIASNRVETVNTGPVPDLRPNPRTISGLGGPECGDSPADFAVKESRSAA